MKRFLIVTGAVCLAGAAAFATERPTLARVTVYWAEGAGADSWTRNYKAATSVRLRSGHCAVDPRKIPYGSKVIFPDGVLTAVDTGGHVKSRRAARRSGRSAAERNAIVVDRFFETKRQALAWARKNPRFMTVRVVPPNKSTITTIVQTRSSTTVATRRLAGGATRTSSTTSQRTLVTKVVSTPAVVPRVPSSPPAPVQQQQLTLRTPVPPRTTPARRAAAAVPTSGRAAPAAATSPEMKAALADAPANRLAANSRLPGSARGKTRQW